MYSRGPEVWGGSGVNLGGGNSRLTELSMWLRGAKRITVQGLGWRSSRCEEESESGVAFEL